MNRGTSMAMALLQAAEKMPAKSLGIEHHIRYRANNSSLGVKREPDVMLNTRQFQGPYQIHKIKPKEHCPETGESCDSCRNGQCMAMEGESARKAAHADQNEHAHSS